MIDLYNKKIGFIGLGISNFHLVKYLSQLTNKIFITENLDIKKFEKMIRELPIFIEYEFGGHSEKILDCDVVIRSPGIPLTNPILKKVKMKNLPLFTEMELSYQIIKYKLKYDPKIVAITGTNGKTTTTVLTGKILSSFYNDVIVAGNIGEPLIKFIDKIKNETIIVLEISSYQLEDIIEFKPHIGCIINISQDHLEHHGSFESYIKAKSNIFLNQNQNDYAVVNFDNDFIKNIHFKDFESNLIFFSLMNKLDEGCFWDEKNKKIIFKYKNLYEEIYINTKLPGQHNIENILASVCCCLLLNVPKKNIETAISEFRGVEHRLEFVREIDGIVFINDSKSTNVDSTLVALKSFYSPIHLILGGRDKGAPYSPLIPLIIEKVKNIFLIGEATEVIYSQLKNLPIKIFKCGTLENAVKKAKNVAKKGDIVLLSPACSSFDQFNNFEHRGNVFKDLVNNL